MRSTLMILVCGSSLLGCAASSSGPTGSADLEAGAERVAYSAWTEWNPSYSLGGNDTMRGWAIFFSKAEPGLDCRQLELDASQVVDIQTQQRATGELGSVPTGAIPITMVNAPIANVPQASIVLDWQDMQGFVGTFTIATFDDNGVVGSFAGTATPFDQTRGATVAVSGTFDAPACGQLAF
jgi:hypothetical protein